MTKKVSTHFKTAVGLAWKYYLWPFSLKRFATALAIQQSIHFGLGSLIYPDIEDFLIDGGYEPAIAQEISLDTPHIVLPLPQDRSFADHIFSVSESFTLPLIAFNIYQNMFLSKGHTSNGLRGCHFSIKPFENYDAKDNLSSYVGARREYIADIPDINRLAFNRTVLHEQQHCNPLLPNLGEFVYQIFATTDEEFEEFQVNDELRSDLEGLRYLPLLAENIDQENIERYTLYFRAISRLHLLYDKFDYEHDVVLQLYAEINEVSPPTREEIIASRKELSDLIREARQESGLQNRSNFEWGRLIPSYDRPEYEGTRVISRYVSLVEAVISENDLSFWAQKRAELYLEAAQYFVPSIAVTYSPKAKEGFKPFAPATP